MAEYHLGISDVTNRIYAGRLNKAGTMFLEKTDVTSEAIERVRDHMYNGAVEEHETQVGIEWILKDGHKVQLILRIVPKEDSDAE